MSYRGRPSKGCEACRARKVKCDEGRPACSRCSKAGHECKYRDQADILFRNQTASAAQRAEESWRKRSKSNQRATVAESSNAYSNTYNNTYIKTPPSDESTPPHLDDTRSSSGSVHSPGGSVDDPAQESSSVASATIDLSRLTITPSLNPDFRRRAFERFVYDFVLPDSPNRPADQPDEALWTFIPLLYQDAPENSLIATAVDAVSYVNFANRYNDSHAQALGEECVGRALPMLTKAIADKKQAATNVALCSVHLMGIYENLTSVQRKGTFLAHNQGANAMLQLRTVEEFYSDIISARLYEVIYAHLLLGNLQAARRPQIPTRDVVKVDELLPSLYKNSNAFVIRLIWRAAMLHARWHETKQSPNPPTNRMALQELLQSALELESDYEAWEANVTPAWNYHMTPNTPEARSTYDAKLQKLFLGCPGAPEEIHIYPSLKRVWIWGFYRTSRILVLRDLLEMLNWMLRFRDPCRSFRPQEAPGQSMPSALGDANLRMHHSVATARLVEVIEKNCSSILGSFTVPIDTKSATDICGMRGYICIWPLGTMDSVLSSGLVPDSNAGKQPHSAAHLPTPPPVHSQPHLATSTSNASSSSEPSTALESYEAAPAFSELRNIRTKSESGQSPGASPPSNTPLLDQNAKKNHIFDPNPAHPYDHPLDLPPLDHGVEPRRIDIAARREWINRLMYYMATELGLKKALWCPVMQGYMPTVKPMVDEILSQERGF